MRIIYGEDFSNTHIVIVRYLPGEDANRFLEQFIEKHPTIGCQMFMECRGAEVSSFTTTSEMYGLIKTLHRVYLYKEFSGLADPQLINMVLKEFPAYNEDDDPIVEDLITSPGSIGHLDIPTSPFDPLKHVVLGESPILPRASMPRFHSRIEVDRRAIDAAMAKLSAIDPLKKAEYDAKRSVLDTFMAHDECWEIDITKPSADSCRVSVNVVFHPERFRPD